MRIRRHCDHRRKRKSGRRLYLGADHRMLKNSPGTDQHEHTADPCHNRYNADSFRAGALLPSEVSDDEKK